MRSLVVTRWMPWPPTSGARQRSANMIAALAALGDVDVFILAGEADAPDAFEVPPTPDCSIARIGGAVRHPKGVRRIDRLVTGLPWSTPSAIRRLDVVGERAALQDWIRGPYDLVWIVRIESWLAARGLVSAPTVIDFDDLRDQLVLSGHRSTWRGGQLERRRRWRSRWADAAEAGAWRRLQRRVASEVDAVTVCTDRDRDRLNVANGGVVPNGVTLPTRPRGRDDVGEMPTLCFFGSLRYGPNADAAELLVLDVAPRVRERIPDVAVRLVGRCDRAVEALADPPRVVVTGLVPDIDDELAKVDVVAVPLREGAGTRIKILEALAHRIPVVATTLAVEGLDVVHGTHVLVADDPDAFADACASLLVDGELRRKLADEGELLARSRYGWERAQANVQLLATAVCGGDLARDAGHDPDR